MTDYIDILEWLNDRGYWIMYEKFEEEFPEVMESLKGHAVTMKNDQNGNLLIPARDLKRIAQESDEVDME